MARAVAAVVALAGCDLVFPSSHAPTDGAGPDGAHVTARIHAYTAKNDTTGAATVTMLDATDASAVRFRDGGTFALAFDPGTQAFGFDVPAPGTPYSIVTTVGGETFEIQHDAGELDYVVRAFGRTPATVAKAPLTSMSLVSGTASTRLYVLGTQEDSGAGVNAGVGFAFPWLDKVLVRSDLGDRLFAVDFEQVTAPRYVRIATMAGPIPAMLDDGKQEMLQPPAKTLEPPSLCASIASARAAEDTRVRSPDGLVGSGWVRDEATWAIETGLAPDVIGPVGLLDLAADRIDANAMLDDLPASTIKYANPSLGGTAAVPQLAAQLVFATRSVRLDGTTGSSAPMRGGTSQYVPLASTATPPCAEASFGPGLAFPHDITFAGTKIETDGVGVTRTPAGDQLLTWTVGSPAPDWYLVVLRQLRNKPDGDATLAAVRTYATNRTEVAISHDLLERGHYVFDIIGMSGYPGAQAGDFRPLTFPAQTVRAFSGVFVIDQ